MKKHVKWFTILEIIIVIGIISILLVAFRNSFQYAQKDSLYAESCVNKLYGDTNNFIYAAMTSKWIYTSGWIIFPEQYIIKFTTGTNSAISLEYKASNGSTGIYINNILNGSWLKNSYCSTAGYTGILSWNRMTVTINKGITQDQNIPTFSISWGNNLFTGGTSFFLCYSGNACKELAMFEIDTRIQSIKRKKCLTLLQWLWSCAKRDQ